MMENLIVWLIFGGAVLFLIRTVWKKKQAISDPCSSGCGNCGGCPLETQGHANERSRNHQV